MRTKIAIILTLCFAIFISLQEGSFAVNTVEEAVAQGVFISDYQPPEEEVFETESELTVEIIDTEIQNQ
jgi:hypothetical protein